METPQTKPWFAEMSLHDLTEFHGTDGLVKRLYYELEEFEPEERAMIQQAFVVASILHAEDPRFGEPYINHPLRVGLRLISHYKVDDADVICAALLHDTVEDHADKLAGPNKTGTDHREAALSSLALWFNPRVSEIVRALTNPIVPDGQDKNEVYYAHINELVRLEDPWPTIIKLSDFTDNATGIFYTRGPKVNRIALKYYPVVDIFKLALLRTDLPISDEVKEHIRQQLDTTTDRLALILQGSL